MRKAAVGAQGRAWSRLDLKTSLLSAHAERMIIRPEIPADGTLRNALLWKPLT
jgi:hypothetical protein